MTASKVAISATLQMSTPNTISISNPKLSQQLKLIITLRQVESPFPTLPVTLLTQYTFLVREPSDAFTLRLLESPRKVDDPHREIWMYPRGIHINRRRFTGDPNIRTREHFDYISIPAVDQGSVTVEFDLSPDNMFRRYHPSLSSLEEKLHLFKSGEEFEIKLRDNSITWWTWGSLDSDELRDKKFARWTFPDDLPLVRRPGEDETDEIVHKLTDPVQFDDVNHLSSHSEPTEEMPDVKKLRAEGWVFGEPIASLNIVEAGRAAFHFID